MKDWRDEASSPKFGSVVGYFIFLQGSFAGWFRVSPVERGRETKTFSQVSCTPESEALPWPMPPYFGELRFLTLGGSSFWRRDEVGRGGTK